MNDIKELSLDEQFKVGTTRRTVIATGAKLAYAVPLVAATVSLTTSGALAVCGGDTPIAFEFEGESLCCGCCDQTDDDAAPQQGGILGAFEACQKLLAEAGTECPLAGEPGDDENRVCIAPDIIT